MFFTIFYLVAFVAIVAVELIAVFNKSKGDTITEHVWKYVTGRTARKGKLYIPTWLAWVNRVALAAFLIWVGPHFILGIWG